MKISRRLFTTLAVMLPIPLRVAFDDQGEAETVEGPAPLAEQADELQQFSATGMGATHRIAVVRLMRGEDCIVRMEIDACGGWTGYFPTPWCRPQIVEGKPMRLECGDPDIALGVIFTRGGQQLASYRAALREEWITLPTMPGPVPAGPVSL